MATGELVRLHNQDYKSLHRALTQRTEKFCDPAFPAEADSIRAGSTAADVEWRRPTELVSSPRLIVNGLSGSDVLQGERGNAWFVTASAALTTRHDLFSGVLPDYPRQDYTAGFHPGIFRFRFVRMGKVYEVVIDDRLPTKRGRLVYCHSGDDNEFWSSLLEKAYAKLHGDYECLRLGRTVDAVSAFVRGVPEHWNLSMVRQEVDIRQEATQSRLWKLFHLYLGKQAVVLFSMQPNGSRRLGDWTPQNLVVGRGYIVKDTKRLQLNDDTWIHLLQLQNSWNDLEWSGAWSDNSPDWKRLSMKSKENFDYKFVKDGLFWMSVEDALTEFTDADICLVLSSSTQGRSWYSCVIQDEWNATARRQRTEKNAGGCYEFPDSYVINPQYLLKVDTEGRQVISFCLEQGDVTSPCQPKNLTEIGLDIFKVEANRRVTLKEPPEASWFKARVEPTKAPNIFLGTAFTSGSYVLVPCTGRPQQEQKFMLRAVSQLNFTISELRDTAPPHGSCCMCCYWTRKAVTRVSVTKVTGLAKFLGKRAGVTALLRIFCEGSDVTSCDSEFYNSDKDNWNVHTVDFRVLLYRHRLSEPIEIELFHSSSTSFMKRLVGKTRVTDADCHQPTEKELQIYDNNEPIDVFITCVVQLAGDITYF